MRYIAVNVAKCYLSVSISHLSLDISIGFFYNCLYLCLYASLFSVIPFLCLSSNYPFIFVFELLSSAMVGGGGMHRATLFILLWG